MITNTRLPLTMALAVMLVGCGSVASADSPSAEPSPTATEATADVCIGRNEQNLDVPMPAAGWGLAWNESDDDARAALLTEVFAEHGKHRQPDLQFASRAEVAEHLAAFRANRPGEYFEWTDWQPWYVQHDRVFMPWRLCGPDGSVLFEGFDLGVIGPDGLFVETTGFYPGE